MQRVRKRLANSKPLKWLFYGDSITQGVIHTFGARDYTQLFAERIRYEMGRKQDVVINTAISGNRIASLIEQFEWRLAQFRPDVVFVMIGMNDCASDDPQDLRRFTDSLGDLAGRITALGAIGIWQTSCPIIPGGAPERESHFDDYMQAVRKSAKNHALPIIDHVRYWEAHADRHWYWMGDAFHPNVHGHRVLASRIFHELDIFDADAPTCRLFVP